MLSQFLYSSIGPFIVMQALKNINKTKFWLSEFIALPLIFLFVTPIFIIFILNLEDWVKDIEISEKYPFLNYKLKLALSLLAIIFVVYYYLLFLI